MDVSYNSVLGDFVWTGDEFNASQPLHSSLMVFFSSACIVLQFSLAYITLGGGGGGVGYRKSGMGGVIFERGGRFF